MPCKVKFWNQMSHTGSIPGKSARNTISSCFKLFQNIKKDVQFMILYRVRSILLQCSVPEGDLHCQCILSIFPASVHQFYANILVFVNINPFLYINDQFALVHSLRFLHILPQKENWLISGRRESPMALLCTATIFFGG